MLVYIYDEAGAPIGLQYRNDTYGVEEFDSFFFEKNLQGDIVAIYNENGVKIGQYQYDAWGNHSAKHFTTKLLDHRILYNYNPFRYRGYYYDLETGFYYLQSRYYNPEWGRFLNADVYVSTGQGLIGNNMYAYCNNNPIMNIDPTGRSFVAATIGGVALWKLLVATGVVAIGAYAVSEAINNTGTTPTGEYLKKRLESLRLRIAIAKAYVNAKVEAGSTEKTDTKEDRAVYYGADIYGGDWKKVTGAMTLEEALAWTAATAASNKYGKQASWGIYTREEADAFTYISCLGICNPIPDRVPGCYPHYHLMGHKYGKYDHFHAWYGDIIK